MFLRLLLFFPGLYLLSTTSFAQSGKTWGLDLFTGAAIPVHKETNETFHAGMNFMVSLENPYLRLGNLKVMPGGGFKWYFKEVQAENSVTEHLRTWKAGLQAEYELELSENLSLVPLLRFDHNWSAHYFSETYNYDPWTNTSTTATSANYLKGTGLSADVGIKAVFKSLFLQVNYEHYQPTLEVNPDLVAQALNDGIIIPSSQKFYFSSMNLNLGMLIKL